MRLGQWLAENGRDIDWLIGEMRRVDPSRKRVHRDSVKTWLRPHGHVGRHRNAALIVAVTDGEVGWSDMLPPRYQQALERRSVPIAQSSGPPPGERKGRAA